MPIQVKVSTSHPELSQLLLRQTPGHSGFWGDCQFHVNQPVAQCDWWFVCHTTALTSAQQTICDPAHLVFISMEPYEAPWQGFYRQFSRLVLCSQAVKHPSITVRNGITWWAGIKVDFSHGHQFSAEIGHDYDSLSRLEPPRHKQNRISVITSNKNFLPGHHQRLAFIDKLRQSELADRIDIYGGGHNPVADKLDAILPYKYHLALENSILDHYWTEKIADAYLGYALPFYRGCRNIGDYFPSDSLVELDIGHDQAIAHLKSALDSDLYSQRFPEIRLARHRVLNDYNLFALMASIATEKAKRFKPCVLRPPASYRPRVRRVLSKLKRTAQGWLP